MIKPDEQQPDTNLPFSSYSAYRLSLPRSIRCASTVRSSSLSIELVTDSVISGQV
jgi:hypothetical protein